MIRRARIEDLQELLDIYNYEVVNGVATFDEVPVTYEQRIEWFEEHQGKYILLVEERDGKVAGYASVSKLFPKPAYNISGEVSVYVGKEFRRQGIGKALLKELLVQTEKEGNFISLFSLITGTNEASIHLHEKLGFTYAGAMKASGMKFGKHLDVVIYRYGLNERESGE